jgi:hypothetical protein
MPRELEDSVDTAIACNIVRAGSRTVARPAQTRNRPLMKLCAYGSS